jgi:EpsI family protein
MTRIVAVLVVLAATAAYVLMNPPPNLALGRGALAAVPVTFGPWNGTELSFEDAVIEELRPDDLLIRRYERGNDRAWLCIVVHQNRRHGAHDPLLCYQSQGWLVGPRSRVRVGDDPGGGLAVNRFVADRPRSDRLVYYWWATPDLATPDRDAFRNRLALSGAIDNRSWGAFVRVETPIGPEGEAEAERRLRDFAARVSQALPSVFSRVEAP